MNFLIGMSIDWIISTVGSRLEFCLIESNGIFAFKLAGLSIILVSVFFFRSGWLKPNGHPPLWVGLTENTWENETDNNTTVIWTNALQATPTVFLFFHYFSSRSNETGASAKVDVLHSPAPLLLFLLLLVCLINRKERNLNPLLPILY